MSVAQPSGLELTPFRGVRYAAEGGTAPHDPAVGNTAAGTAAAREAAAVTAPPYDLINDADADILRSAHPHNVVRLIRPAGEDSDRYNSARETLGRWLASGVLRTDRAEALYVYEERSAAGTQRGLMGGVHLARPDAGLVLPHEDTTPGPINDRLRLLRATEANLEPIFLLYEGGGAASRVVDDVADGSAPVCVAATPEGVTYRLWAITDRRRQDVIARDLHQRTALIADGHHRYATYLRYQEEQHAGGLGQGPWDYGLAMLVDSSTHPPRLEAVHRVVPGLAPTDAARYAEGAFQVTPLGTADDRAQQELADAARRGPALLLGGDGTNTLLTDPDPRFLKENMPAQRSARWQQLSTAVLHHLLMPAVWGMQDDERTVLTVHHDAPAARRLASQSGGTAVILPALHVADVLTVARQGEPVPRKSTSFGPKPRTGLVLRTLDAS